MSRLTEKITALFRPAKPKQDDASMQLKAVAARAYTTTPETRTGDTPGAFGGKAKGNRRSYKNRKTKRKGKR